MKFSGTIDILPNPDNRPASKLSDYTRFAFYNQLTRVLLEGMDIAKARPGQKVKLIFEFEVKA